MFATAPNLQRAVAFGLAKDQAYFGALATDMARKKDILSNGLTRAGFGVLPCNGSYFVMADISALANGLDDVAFARQLTEQARVTPIPASAFYDSQSGTPPKNLVRFAFCKREEVLIEAVSRIERWKNDRE